MATSVVKSKEPIETIETDETNETNETNRQENCESQNDPERNDKIAELAYFKAQNRDFEPGHELDDWIEAEREVLQCGD